MTKGKTKTQNKNNPPDAGQPFRGVKQMRYVCSWIDSVTDQQCSKRFNESGHLKIHMRIHTQCKPFHCNICGKDFSVVGNRNDHM